MATVVYGIPNCDSVKKTRRWLADNGVDYEFHDYKKLGIDEPRLKRWCKDLGWETVLNKRGTTFRKLDDGVKTDLTEKRAIQLMVEHTSLIKRPVIEHGKALLIGFDEAACKKALG